MKRTKLNKSKLRLNAETLAMLQPNNLQRVNGGKCMGTNGTSTFADGNCTNRCNTQFSCDCDTAAQCILTAYC